MVADNVERLKRIVDDVMEVAPGLAHEVPVHRRHGAGRGHLQRLGACGRALRLGERSVLRVELPHEPLGVVFDAEHLRRVLVNLLDNAHRHASGAARRDASCGWTRATRRGPF